VELFFSSSSPSTARGRSCLRACGGMLNLDTHVLLHALTGDLTRRESALFAHDTWSISGSGRSPSSRDSAASLLGVGVRV